MELLRTQGLAAYSGTGSSPSTFTLLSTGNVAANLMPANPDTTNFKLVVNASTDCVSASGSLSVIAGGECALSSSFTPSGSNNYNNTVLFAGNAANASLASPPTLQLTQIGSNVAPAVSVTITGTTPVNPVAGDSITVTASVIASSGSASGVPSGNVVFSVDGVAVPAVSVVSGVASATLGSLAAGAHTITAAFTSTDSSFASGSASPVTIAVSAGAVQLVSGVVLSKVPDGSYQAVVTVANNGGAVANGVTLTTLTLGSAAGSSLPVSLDTLPAGASKNVTITLPASAGPSGTAAVVRFSGNYAGGTFGGALRVRLP